MELLVNKTNKINEFVHRPAEMLNGEPIRHGRRQVKALHAHWLRMAGA